MVGVGVGHAQAVGLQSDQVELKLMFLLHVLLFVYGFNRTRWN